MDIEDVDVFFSILNGWVEEGVEIPVILCVGGAIISGDLISQEKYFRELGSRYRGTQSQPPAVSSAIAEAIENLPDKIDNLFAATYAEDDEKAQEERAQELRGRLSQTFVHLRNTQVMVGGDFVPFDGSFWRGKQKNIDGYWLGSPG